MKPKSARVRNYQVAVPGIQAKTLDSLMDKDPSRHWAAKQNSSRSRIQGITDVTSRERVVNA